MLGPAGAAVKVSYSWVSISGEALTPGPSPASGRGVNSQNVFALLPSLACGRGAGGEGRYRIVSMGAGRFGKRGREARARAQEFRREPTRAEWWLWDALRDRKLAGWKFRRQFPLDSYVLDFYCPELRLVVEVDGGIHLDPPQATHDANRDIHLSSIGCTILRVTNEAVLEDLPAVLRLIEETATDLASAAPSGSSSPLSRSRERGRG
jgi:very-short-patch-repair endonuclease